MLALYYYEEMTLREIAKIVDLHESRISQLKSQAVLRLNPTCKNAGLFSAVAHEQFRRVKSLLRVFERGDFKRELFMLARDDEGSWRTRLAAHPQKSRYVMG